MTSPQPPTIRIRLAASFLIAMLLAGCAPKIIRSTPHRTVLTVPGKQPPPDALVHPTQRPYNIAGKSYYPIPSAKGYTEAGVASWYGHDFHGRKTSNGETYNMYDWTAAHKTLPMNTTLLVKNLDNGREAVVRVNDRGPFAKGRLIDVSYNVARQLEIIKNGTARVRLTALAEAVSHGSGSKTITRLLPFQDFSHGEYFVQVGAFSDKTNSKRLQDQISRWGKNAVTVTHEYGGQLFYRVQVQAGTSMDEAKRMERVLAEAGFPEAFVLAR
jgi:rare lipoprotein A